MLWPRSQARAGYVNPDDTTFDYLRGRPFVPAGDAFDRAVAYWRSTASSPTAVYDDVVELAAAEIEPTITWGINPSQSVGVSQRLPSPEETTDPFTAKRAYEHTGFTPGSSVREIPIAYVLARPLGFGPP